MPTWMRQWSALSTKAAVLFRNDQRLPRVMLPQIRAGAEVHAPAECAMVFALAVLRAEIADQRAELQVPESCFLEARVEAQVRYARKG